MSSAAAALKQASLVVAVCVMLLHSSLGQQPPLPSPDCPYTGQQPPPPSPTPVVPTPTSSAPTPEPAPWPTPTPMPLSPAPAPAPAPAPVNNCSYSDCASQCDASCRAASSAGIANCPRSDHAAAFNACYEICTSHSCPGKSCVHSGCGLGDCGSCHTRDAGSCCEQCSNAVTSSPDPVYQQCLSGWQKSTAYCVMGCQASCSKRGCV